MSKTQDDFRRLYPPKENKTWPAMLGNPSGVIAAGNGLVYVTTMDGQVLKLPNKKVPKVVQPVLIGYSPDDPYTLRVLSEWEVFVKPMVNSLIDHHSNHEYPAFDTVWIKLEQIKWLLCLPTSGFTIQIHGGIVMRNGLCTTVANQTFTIAHPYDPPATGALWVLIESDSSGVVSAVYGTPVAAKELLANTDIPARTSGSFPLCAIKVYDSQDKLRRGDSINDFVDLRFTGATINSLTDLQDVVLTSPDDNDVLTYDSSDGLWKNEAGAGGGGDISGTGVIGQVAEFVTDTKTLQAAKIIGPAVNILTITNAAAATLGLAITAGKTLTLTSTNDFNLTVPATGTAALLGTANSFTAMQTITATADAALSAEYITDIQNRDFSAATDWAGTNWKIPLLAVAQANDITVAAAGKTFTRTAGSFLTDGFQVGMSVTWSGFAKAGTLNNGTFTISTVTALVMTCSTATLSDEVPADYVACSATSPVWSHAVAGANAATLANAKLTAAPAAGEFFQITITVRTLTTNTLTISIGGMPMAPVIGKTTTPLTAYTFNILTSNAGVLTITPGATWLGWVDDISVKKVTPSSVLLTGKMADTTTVLETIVPNVTSFGIGFQALKSSVQINCVAIGYQALYENTANNNTAIGYQALYKNPSTATGCNAQGYQALYENYGTQCNAQGAFALYQNTGGNCSAQGYQALYQNTGGTSTGVGSAALYQNTAAESTAVGYSAMYNNTGAGCVGVGIQVLYGNTGANCNAIGSSALRGNTAAGNNAIGVNAGRYIADGATVRTTGTTSLFLGNNTRALALAQNNQIVIGDSAIGAGANSVTLGNTSIISTVLRGTVGITGLSDRVQLQVTGFTTQTAAPVNFIDNTAATNTVRNILQIETQSTGTPANGLGAGMVWALESSTTASTLAGLISASWIDVTHATRKAKLSLSAYDTAARLGMEIEASGTAAKIGIFGHATALQPATWTLSNDATLRTIDAHSLTLDNLADAFCTLVKDLESVGYIG